MHSPLMIDQSQEVIVVKSGKICCSRKETASYCERERYETARTVVAMLREEPDDVLALTNMVQFGAASTKNQSCEYTPSIYSVCTYNKQIN